MRYLYLYNSPGYTKSVNYLPHSLSHPFCSRASDLKYWENIHLPQHVTCHVSCVTCHVSCVTCHASCVACHVSCVNFVINLVELVEGLLSTRPTPSSFENITHASYGEGGLLFSSDGPVKLIHGHWLHSSSKMHHTLAQYRFEGIFGFVCARFSKKYL